MNPGPTLNREVWPVVLVPASRLSTWLWRDLALLCVRHARWQWTAGDTRKGGGHHDARVISDIRKRTAPFRAESWSAPWCHHEGRLTPESSRLPGGESAGSSDLSGAPGLGGECCLVVNGSREAQSTIARSSVTAGFVVISPATAAHAIAERGQWSTPDGPAGAAEPPARSIPVPCEESGWRLA